MPAIIAKKIGMSRIFDEHGNHLPVTLVEVGENIVISNEGNSNEETKVRIGIKSKKRANKPIQGMLKKTGTKETLTKFKSFESDQDLKVGQVIGINDFNVGDMVRVSANTKGKGFAGTIKRHGFKRGPVSHGSHNIRQPGSIGAQQPQRVIKGKKMAGHMGTARRTLKNVKVAGIDKDNQLLALAGSIPGPNKNWVMLWSE